MTKSKSTARKARREATWERVSRSLAFYVIAAGLSLVCIWVLAGLGKADLRYPIAGLDGDALLTQAVLFKGLVDNPWCLENRWLGAPFGANLRDFTGPDVLIFAAVKFVAFFTSNHILVRNIIAIASYPLVALTSLYAMRRLGVRYSIALAASLLYAFISYHQHRIGAHIQLAIGYFTVPLATLLTTRLYENEPLVIVSATGRPGLRFLANRQTWAALAWCAAIGTSGLAYYTFFACYFMLLAGSLAAVRVRSFVPVLRAGCLCFASAAALVAGMSPFLLHRWVHGSSNSIVRSPEGAETYALKIVQMIIPSGGHRIPALQHLADYYNRTAPLVNENTTAYLGVLGVLGFVYLIYVLLRGEQHDLRLRALSLSNILAILLATIGGFSSLIGFLLTDNIRSYNRISVFVAFFSLLTLAVLAERFASKHVTTRLRNSVMTVVLCALTLAGLLDEYWQNIDYGSLKQEYMKKAEFVAKVENSLPPNSAIFQYPYVPFPEHGPVAKMHDYAEFWPYLHSSKLRWSYGTVKGRREDAWQANLNGMGADQALDTLTLAGFSGIFVARDGYSDRGKGLEEGLRSKLGAPTLVSQDGGTAFYSILDRQKRMQSELGAKEFERRKQDVLNPVYLGWLGGCHRPFRGQIACKSKGHFVIENPSSIPTHLVLEAKLGLPTEPPATVHLRSDIFDRDYKVTTSWSPLSEGFDVPPGEHIFTVTTDAPEVVDEHYRRVAITFDNPHLEVVVRTGSFDDTK